MTTGRIFDVGARCAPLSHAGDYDLFNQNSESFLAQLRASLITDKSKG